MTTHRPEMVPDRPEMMTRCLRIRQIQCSWQTLMACVTLCVYGMLTWQQVWMLTWQVWMAHDGVPALDCFAGPALECCAADTQQMSGATG